mmetsp:Transcript_337/g.389  ORF Transcript_337/g.389 Transcript_337/m.389 type:complete len:216 (+) Transcript_337:65-712(+)
MGSAQSQQVQDLTAPLVRETQQLKATLAENETFLSITKKEIKSLESKLVQKTCENCIKIESDRETSHREWEELADVLSKNVISHDEEVQHLKAKLKEAEAAIAKKKDEPCEEELKLQEKISEMEFEVVILMSQEPPETSQGQFNEEELKEQLIEERTMRERAEEENFKQLSEMFDIGGRLEEANTEVTKLKEMLKKLEEEKQQLEQTLENFFAEK